MGRDHTFMDREFGRSDYDPDDKGTFESGLVFVMMPFVSEDSNQVYVAIRDACARKGLRAERVDDSGGSGFIIREVTECIERAEFIVCDLSHERPNVYYELGYAHGVGNEPDDILLIARAGTKLHFDIAPLRAHYFDDLAELEILVEAQMSRMIHVTRR
jgi:hypothetical protein